MKFLVVNYSLPFKRGWLPELSLHFLFSSFSACLKDVRAYSPFAVIPIILVVRYAAYVISLSLQILAEEVKISANFSRIL